MLLHSIAYMQSQIHNEIHELYFANQLTSMHFTVFRAASIFAGSSLWANEVECKISVQQSKAVKIHAHTHTHTKREGERELSLQKQEQKHNNSERKRNDTIQHKKQHRQQLQQKKKNTFKQMMNIVSCLVEPL